MPIMEGGLFVMMGGTGFILLIISFKFGALLKALSAVMFFSLALVLLAGYEVAYTSELTQGTSAGNDCTVAEPCIERNFLIREDDDTGETSGEFYAWVFIALGILSSMLFIIEMIPR